MAAGGNKGGMGTAFLVVSVLAIGGGLLTMIGIIGSGTIGAWFLGLLINIAGLILLHVTREQKWLMPIAAGLTWALFMATAVSFLLACIMGAIIWGFVQFFVSHVNSSGR